mmetsp:Transcript_67168/g.160870  ORF Transcript_67168/g.160870 Transcript_67168/m.160870 type:complete len:204 (-) Transcript_67168:384-995(-)
MVQRQAPVNWSSKDNEVERQPNGQACEVVLVEVLPVLLHGTARNVLLQGCEGSSLHQLLEDVEDWEVDECLEQEVVIANLLEEVDAASSVMKLDLPGRICKLDRVWAQESEDGDVEEPLHHSHVDKAERCEACAPSPINAGGCPSLYLSKLHDQICKPRLEGGHNHVERSWPSLREGQHFLFVVGVWHIYGYPVAHLQPFREE